MDPMAFLDYLRNLDAQGLLEGAFEPYQQEEDVLNKKQALHQGLMQPGPQHTSPLGALLGGLSDAAGKIGGNYLQKGDLAGLTGIGQHMQADAVGRVRSMFPGGAGDPNLALLKALGGSGDFDPSLFAGLA